MPSGLFFPIKTAKRIMPEAATVERSERTTRPGTVSSNQTMCVGETLVTRKSAKSVLFSMSFGASVVIEMEQ